MINDQLQKLRKIYSLKNVERSTSVSNRKESSAEHSWSCLILADYFLSKNQLNLNRLKVYELLMYHDLIEIETGDVCISNVKERNSRESEENKARPILAKKLPPSLSEKFSSLFLEFQEQKTVEARFAKAIDKLDATLHELDHKKDWSGWTEQFLRETKEKYMSEFPEVKDTFETILNFARKKKYFDRNHN
ncbi:HD domain-containing protein [Candidatus Woesearchaeota archaeon]|nr:HD domain-containing protein [Candidatus Woesearchaeota archaeon]